MCAAELVDDVDGFFTGEDGGQALGTFGTAEENGFDFLVKNIAVEEEDGAKGLTSTGSVQGFWVDAATLRSTARWVIKARISGAPISSGCFLTFDGLSPGL